MADSNVSRRGLLQILGTVPAAAGALAAEPHMHNMAPPAVDKAVLSGPGYKRQTFNDHQWETVKVLCDLVIPKDDRSVGATEAGVPEFLDDWIAYRETQDGNDNLKAEIFGGLMWLDRESNKQSQKNFADTTADQQKQILDRVAYTQKTAPEDKIWEHFFSEFRSLTVGGFFSSKVGVADLPYLGNVAVAEWNGCDPKVWAVIEERLKNGYKGILEAKPWKASSQG